MPVKSKQKTKLIDLLTQYQQTYKNNPSRCTICAPFNFTSSWVFFAPLQRRLSCKNKATAFYTCRKCEETKICKPGCKKKTGMYERAFGAVSKNPRPSSAS